VVTLIAPPGLKNLKGMQPAMEPNPPLGLAYIAGTLKGNGIDYHVIDGAGEALDQIKKFKHQSLKEDSDFYIQGLSIEEIVERIPENPEIVAISCLFSINWLCTKELARQIRQKFPESILVIGGEHSSACPEYCLTNSDFDIVVIGEGEETFLNLVTKINSNDPTIYSTPGIAHYQDGHFVMTDRAIRIKQVDEIELPDWDSFPIEEYIDRHQINGANLGRSMPILATRGCPYLCTFCSSPNMWTTRYIARDTNKLIAEMEYYIDKYKVVNFDFQDLTAIVKKQWAIKFCQEIIDRNLNITWQLPSGTRSEVFDDNVIDLLYRSGCKFLAFAPESGSKEVLKVIKKQVNLESLFKSAKAATKRGINVTCFFVIGFSADSKNSLRETMAVIRKLAIAGIGDVVVSKFAPYPGSALFDELEKEGMLKLDDRYFIHNINYFSAGNPSYAKEVSSKELYKTQVYMFLNFYCLSVIFHPIKFIKVILNALLKGEETTRYAKWLVDKILSYGKWKKIFKNKNKNEELITSPY
jgi:anaerobic magnesium-protoporphyrin IX monomethyl ester cyclase